MNTQKDLDDALKYGLMAAGISAGIIGGMHTVKYFVEKNENTISACPPQINEQFKSAASKIDDGRTKTPNTETHYQFADGTFCAISFK